MARRKKTRASAPRKIVMTEAEQQAASDKAAQDEAVKRADRAEDRRVKAMPGGVVNRDRRTGKALSREVLDVVMMMRRTKDAEGRSLIGDEEAGAVRTLERLIEKANGGGGSCLATLERVNGQSTGDPTLASVIRHTEAAHDLNARQSRLGPKTWAMLRELCDGNLGLGTWHGVVKAHTGEANPSARGAIVRQSFRELAQVERDIFQKRPANDRTPQYRAMAS